MTPWSRIAVAAAVAGALTLAAAPSTAATIEGVHFAPTITAGDVSLDLTGKALLRYKVLFKAYVAALYLAAPEDRSHVLSDVPKRLEIEYFWGISAVDFRKATVDGIAANLSEDALAKVRPKIDLFNTFYSDVEPGDRYTLTYLPGVGTELALNGKRRGIVDGDTFGSALFSIWFGEDPFDADLKSSLLGSAKQ